MFISYSVDSEPLGKIIFLQKYCLLNAPVRNPLYDDVDEAFSTYSNQVYLIQK